jgi:phosphatidylinositol alpha-1,6-mannosyltransferase
VKTTAGSGAPRIILVSELFPPTIGGSAVLLSNIYRRLAGTGVTVLSDSAGGGSESDDSAFHSVKLPMKLESWGIVNRVSAGVYWKLARAIRSASAGPAIAYCARALPEGLAALIAHSLLGGPRYVCWTHGEELVTYGTSRELMLLLRQVHRHAAALVANSQHTAAMLERLGVSRERIHLVYPGVDAERFAVGDGRDMRRRLGWERETVLVSVGRLQRRKGHDLAIRAVASLCATLPELRYLIVGDGEERPRLEALVRERGLGERVRFVGALHEQDLPDAYAAGDIFLHPNRVDSDGDLEGFGIVFLEAAAAGLPSIGGRSGGVPEAVEDDVTGVLVSGTDVDELAGAIARLTVSPDLRLRLGSAARSRAERFSWTRAAESVSALHHRLADAG